MVARRSRRTKRYDREAPSICRGGLVSLARRIAGRRRESFGARDYRPCRSTGRLSRIPEWNRYGPVRHCCGSAPRTGVRRVCPDRPRCSIRSSAAHALGSNCRPRRWKLDRSQRSLDARLGSSNTLGTLFATAIGEPLRSRRRTTRRACLDDKLLAALLIASCPRFGEFVPGLPANQRWLVGREPSQRDTEARRHRVAAKIHLRIIFVARLVV